jgi:hypothetical protein
MNKFRVGFHIVNNTLRGHFNRPVLDAINNEAKRDKLRELMYRIMNEQDNKSNLYFLRLKFRHWLVRVGDTEVMVHRFRDLAQRYILSKPAHDELVKKPSDVLVETMKSWVALKKEKAQSVQEYCKTILKICRRMVIIKRNGELHKLFQEQDLNMNSMCRFLFSRWHRMLLLFQIF